MMIELFQRIADAIRSPYAPDPHRRKEILEVLSRRPALSNAEWHNRYTQAYKIPIEFTSWYRETCSKCFEYDLSGALPDDRLVDDLGLYDATWGDTDWDILEECGIDLEDEGLKDIQTFGELLNYAWEKTQELEQKMT